MSFSEWIAALAGSLAMTGAVPFWIAKFARNEAEKYFKAKKLRSAELLLYA
jgi:hypothetical protein